MKTRLLYALGSVAYFLRIWPLYSWAMLKSVDTDPEGRFWQKCNQAPD